jgi:hypothetical protein
LGSAQLANARWGFGGRINNGAGQVRLTDLYDFFGPPSSLLIVGAREDPDGFAGQWSLSSSCAAGPSHPSRT